METDGTLKEKRKKRKNDEKKKKLKEKKQKLEEQLIENGKKLNR